MAGRGNFSFEGEEHGTGDSLGATDTGGSLSGDGGGGGDDSGSGGGGVAGSGFGDGGPIDPRSLAGTASEPGGGDERDSAGVRWDAARHSSSRAKTADGRWRTRRGLGGNASGNPRAQRRTAKDTLAVSEVRMFLAGTHAALAQLTHTPELKLEGDDAQNLAVPLTEIANMYDIPVTKEMRLFSMLAIACVAVYGPRIQAIRQRHKAQRARPTGSGSTAPPAPQAPPAPTFRPAGQPPQADPSLPIIVDKLN